MPNNPSYQIDFPTFLPSFLVKELRQGLRSPYFTWTLIIVPIFIAFSYISSMSRGSDASDIGITSWSVLSVALLMIPFRAKSALQEEMESRSIDLLILSRLNPWGIVWGKWCSYMAQALLIMVLMLPFFFVRYYFGNVNLLADLYALCCAFIATGVITALVIWISGMPTVLRIISFISVVSGLLWMVVALLTISAVSLAYGGSTMPDFVFPLWLIIPNAAVFILLFLLLASRWIETASSNSSIPVRLLVLAPFLIYALLSLFSGPDSQDLLKIQLIISLAFGFCVFIIELTMPKKILPVHFANIAKTRFALLKKLFLMPDFFSASLAFTLFLVLAVIVYLIWVPPSIARQSAWVVLFIWFSIHAPAFFASLIGPKKQDRRIYGLLIYGLLLIPCSMANAFLYASGTFKAFAILIPWGFAGVIENFDSKSSLIGDTVFFYILSALIAVIGIIVIGASSESWRKALAESRKLSYLNNDD